MPYSFLSLNDLKNHIGELNTANDAKLRSVLEGVARSFNKEAGHGFQTHLATRYFEADHEWRLRVHPGLLAVTTLKTDEDGDRIYEQTWATTDFDLEPANALTEEEPYTRLMVPPRGSRSFPIGMPRGVEIVGKWGYLERLLRAASTLNGALNASATTVAVTAGTDFEVLQTILVDTEQMYITAIVTNNLTVQRGVNGTTTASHLTGAAIDIYDYPSDLANATAVQAARIFRRKDSPLGVVGGMDFGLLRGIPSIDPDVKIMLGSLTRLASRIA